MACHSDDDVIINHQLNQITTKFFERCQLSRGFDDVERKIRVAQCLADIKASIHASDLTKFGSFIHELLIEIIQTFNITSTSYRMGYDKSMNAILDFLLEYQNEIVDPTIKRNFSYISDDLQWCLEGIQKSMIKESEFSLEEKNRLIVCVSLLGESIKEILFHIFNKKKENIKSPRYAKAYNKVVVTELPTVELPTERPIRESKPKLSKFPKGGSKTVYGGSTIVSNKISTYTGDDFKEADIYLREKQDAYLKEHMEKVPKANLCDCHDSKCDKSHSPFEVLTYSPLFKKYKCENKEHYSEELCNELSGKRLNCPYYHIDNVNPFNYTPKSRICKYRRTCGNKDCLFSHSVEEICWYNINYRKKECKFHADGKKCPKPNLCLGYHDIDQRRHPDHNRYDCVGKKDQIPMNSCYSIISKWIEDNSSTSTSTAVIPLKVEFKTDPKSKESYNKFEPLVDEMCNNTHSNSDDSDTESHISNKEE